MTTVKVQLKTIDRFPGYRFGDDGSVWSEWRSGGYRGNYFRSGVWVQLKPTAFRHGYMYLTLCGKKHTVHRLILEAFVGTCPDGMEACHNNGDRSDNRIVNLRWDTRKNNHRDKKKHGTQQVGERGSNAKLTDKEALEIRRLRKNGMKQGEIAKMFGISQSSVSSIILRRTHRHI